MSVGELLDKITILKIKARELSVESQLANVERELAALEAVRARALGCTPHLEPLVEALAEVNATLWRIEDALREHESRGDFSAAFVELARSVYLRNDERAAIKREINELSGSLFVEEKSYSRGEGSST
ncbi:MAG: DUF6165 family protein [Enhygromyxa sp.]